MNQKELNIFKQVLLQKKEFLLNEVRKNKENRENYQFSEVGDSADIAADSYEKEFLFGLTDKEQKLLNNIEIALQKIENKSYGICEECGGKIGHDRLNAVPFACLCIECQAKKDSK